MQEKASNLSGGQCQRLALARALLHDSPIYIFDEATSNIDIESENDIMQEIHRLAKTKTVILISHRLMNVKDADCIYVMDKGCLVEEGKHEELLQKNQVYANLWETQQILRKLWKGGYKMNQRSGMKVMMKLVGLVKPLTSYMILAIVMGLIGHLMATMITVFGVYALLHLLGFEIFLTLQQLFLMMIIFAMFRGIFIMGNKHVIIL